MKPPSLLPQYRIHWQGNGGAEKHKIYAVAFGSHLFYDLFLQDQGAWPHWISDSARIALEQNKLSIRGIEPYTTLGL